VAATAHMNDNPNRLPDLLTCIVCNQTMKLEKIDPDDKGNDLIQYRCKSMSAHRTGAASPRPVA
jgi:hypothetical protein